MMVNDREWRLYKNDGYGRLYMIMDFYPWLQNSELTASPPRLLNDSSRYFVLSGLPLVMHGLSPM